MNDLGRPMIVSRCGATLTDIEAGVPEPTNWFYRRVAFRRKSR
jgi:hypothetical protein